MTSRLTMIIWSVKRSWTGQTDLAPMTSPPNNRLYQHVARELVAAIVEGRYAIGDRLPAERELALEFDVSRPTVREAIIALEAQGLVEVRLGSGAYVRQSPGQPIGFGITAFEVVEARLLVESEAAALAAAQITDDELETLSVLVDQIEQGHFAED